MGDYDSGSNAGNAISVDLQGLRDFGGKLRGDLDGSLKPGTDRISQRFQYGVGFGRHSASNEVNAAARHYYNCLTASTDLLATYLRITETISDAAAQIADAYGRADAFSAATTKYVQDMLGAAAKRIDDAQAAADKARQEAARQADLDEQWFLRHRHGGSR
jgi:hypothetical protein